MSDTRLSPVCEVKFAPAPALGEFSGYASTFGGPVDSYGDLIAAGSFQHTLQKHAQEGSAPAMLWAHDPAEPIGKWLSISEDAHGLAVQGRLTLGVQRADDAHKLLRDSALGLSIGFRALESKPVNGARLLTRIQLFEVSLVSVAANPAARVTSVKSVLAKPDDIRTFEALLRDALGFSVRESKRLASGGWPCFARRDDASEELQQVAALLQSAARTFTPKEK